jgi:enamine deaminase RidA (YjgF/YER057c/UK114 family)
MTTKLLRPTDSPNREKETEMTEIVKIKSGSPYEESESYSRIVSVDNWIMVSNTAGVDYASQVFPDTAVGQTEQSLRNVQGALEAAGSSLADVVNSRITIPNPDDAEAVMAEVGRWFRGIDPARTVLCSPLGGAHLKVEIEVTAYRGAGTSHQERIQIQL